MFSATSLLSVLTISVLIITAKSNQKRKIFVDVTSNKLTRENDGSFGMWSFHGIAKESHVKENEFIFNADLVEDNKHVHIASALYPRIGLTSDLDPVYQEYLIIQSQLVGVDGFLVEWGYKGHASDIALQNYISLVKSHQPFVLGVNWCDHWLMETLANASRSKVLEAFHENLQYLIDSLFVAGPESSLFYDKHPVIYLFGGGLTSDLFKDLISMPLNLKPGVEKPIWIGSYLNFVSDNKWNEWSGLLNGTFGWVPPRTSPTPPDIHLWDYYASLDDVTKYLETVKNFGSACLKKAECVLWVGSASPQFDNRGCAGWGRSLTKMEEWQKDNLTGIILNIFDVQWRYHNNHPTTTDTILIPTLNDFPEASVVLATNETDLQSLNSILFFAREWKQKRYQGNDGFLLFGFLDWYGIYKEAQYLGRTPNIDSSKVVKAIEDVSQFVSQQNIENAMKSLTEARTNLQQLRSKVKTEFIGIQAPSDQLYTVVTPVTDKDGNYIINSTAGLYLQLSQSTADTINNCNFKGYMTFQYKLLDSKFSHLVATSSTNRTVNTKYTQLNIGGSREATHQSIGGSKQVNSKFAEICDIMCNSPGSWQSANVTLYRQNQAWDRSAKYSSDLYFTADANFLVRKIYLGIETWQAK